MWLTTDPEPDGHGLDGGRLDKRAVRVTVDLPKDDSRLRHWPRWARHRLDRGWYETLDRAGGGKSDTWWIYRWVVSPARFARVEDLRRGIEVPVPSVAAAPSEAALWRREEQRHTRWRREFLRCAPVPESARTAQ